MKIVQIIKVDAGDMPLVALRIGASVHVAGVDRDGSL